MISIMEGCSSMSQWSNIYELEGGIDTSKSTSLFIDPIQEFQSNDHQGSGVISWGGGAPIDLCTTTLPMNTVIIQSRPLDASNGGATSSVDRSLECLLSGTFSNTDNTSDEDDGISLLFSSNFNTNYLNFSYDNNNNNDNNSNNNSNNNSTKCNNNNIYPRKRSHHNMHTIQENHPKSNSTTHNTTTSGPKGNNKRQRQRYSLNNNNLNARSKIQFSSNSSLNISFQQVGSSSGTALLGANNAEPDAEAIQQMKEMIYRAAAFRPVNFGTEELEKPNKRKNVRISSDPQTVAARQRRERISERLRVLQKLVPGGTKMDTATMLDEAANYLRFLRNQVKDLENLGNYKLNNQHHYNNSTNSFNQFSPLPSKNMQYLPMNP